MASPRRGPEEQELFCACLELTPEERRLYLARACKGRPELARRIEGLLAAHRLAEGAAAAPLAPPAEPGRAEPPPIGPPRRSRIRRGTSIARHPLATTAAVLLVAALAVAVAAWQARRAAARARQAESIHEFLVTVLEDTAPAGSPGSPATVLDALRRASAQLRSDPTRPVELRVELLCIVGEALLAHEDGAAAEEALDAAVAEARRSLGADHVLTLRARTLRASAHRLRGRTARLREELELTLPALRAAPGELGEELVVALQDLCHVELERGRYEQAEAAAEEALARATELLGPRHAETASAASTLALAARYTGDAETALARSEEAHRLARDAFRGSPSHPRVLDAEVLYGRALADAGRLSDGLARVQGATDRARDAFGAESRRAALFGAELARLRLASGEIAPALEALAASLPVVERHYGPASLQYASALEIRGEVLLAARRSGEAAADLARTVELLEAALGASHDRVHKAATTHALARAYAGETAEAVRQLQDVLAADRAGGGPGTARARHALGVAQRLAGEPAAALRLQQAWLASLAPGRGSERDRVAALSEIGLAQVALGRFDDAVTPLLRALTAFEERQPDLTPERADLLVALGHARLGQGRAAEALEPLETADRFWRRYDPESAWAAEAARGLERCRTETARRGGARRAVTDPSALD